MFVCFLGYDWSLFISDLGGSLGFLLGLSVLGIIGIFERIIELCCCVVLFSEEPIIERYCFNYISIKSKIFIILLILKREYFWTI